MILFSVAFCAGGVRILLHEAEQQCYVEVEEGVAALAEGCCRCREEKDEEEAKQSGGELFW